MTLLLLQYNNYFNRVIKVDTYEGYITHTHKLVSGVAFNPNDGVETEQIINWTESFNPDYCVVINENSEIVSRWFIKEAVRTRNGQYRLSLRRDLLADYNSEVLNAPCFIEKGYVSNNSPLIFNKEDFNANQLRKGEVLLTDETRCSWIVLYYNLSKKDELSGTIANVTEPYVALGANTLEDWDKYQLLKNGAKELVDKSLEVRYDFFWAEKSFPHLIHSLYYKSIFKLNENREMYLENSTSWEATDKGTYLRSDAMMNSGEYGIIERFKRRGINTISNNMFAADPQIGINFSNYVDSRQINEARQLEGKLFKTRDGKYYRVRIVPEDNEITTSMLNETNDTYNVYGLFKQKMFYNKGDFIEEFSERISKSVFLNLNYFRYRVEFNQVLPPSYTFSYSFENCLDVKDQPYGVLVLPYKNVDGNPIKFGFDNQVEEDISIKIARDLCKAGVGTDKVIYDAQILPYCPMNIDIFPGQRLNIGALDSYNYSYILDSGGNRLGFALHPNTTKFNKTINVLTDLVLKHIELDDDIKVEHSLNFYRLVSPNWNGQAQFSGAMNNGIKYVNIECTYKPYQPYIHINPVWGGLYVGDNNTARGLICGGDFSLTVVGSAWENYKLQNKNFEAQFSRDIEHMDTTHSIDRAKNIAGLGISTVGGAVGGAIVKKNPASIGAGALVGLASGVTNIVAGEQQYQENRDYTIDQHNYQLGNIQALPNSLNKVDAYNNNNKMFPFIEKYTCTDKEKEIFKNKLKYEGMTVNALGKISDYLNYGGEETFVKGQIIRLSDISEDSHLAYAIYEEVSKGVYL